MQLAEPEAAALLYPLYGGTPFASNDRDWAGCRRSVSFIAIDSFRQDRTFIGADLNDRLWSKAATS
jgi:hypothetical protein